VGLIDKTDFSIKPMSQEITDKISKYSKERQSFYSNSPAWVWSHMYKHGLDGMSKHANKYLNRLYKPKPKKPIVKD
jgi:hypothetical protein